MINSVVKVKMNSFHFEFHRIDLVVLFVLCTICMSKISERNQDNTGPFTWRKEDPTRGNNFTLGLHAEIAVRVACKCRSRSRRN